MTITLIDSENLGKDWIAAASAFPADLHLVFYTRHSPAIPIEDLPRIIAALPHIEFIECCTGSNALDFQLVTELGYRLAKEPDTDYVILAKDTGYDAAVRYWRGKGFRVKRIPSVKLPAAPVEAPTVAEADPAEVLPGESAPADALPNEISAAGITPALPAEEPAAPDVPPAEAETPASQEDSAEIKSTEASAAEEEPALVSSEPAAEPSIPAEPAPAKEAAPAPKKRGRKPKAKPAEKEFAPEAESKPATLTERLQAAGLKELSQAEPLARIILDHANAPEAKRLQETYQAIISRFGQKRGLDYYRKSKDIIKKLSVK